VRRRLLLGVAAILIAVQFVPVNRGNPPVTGEISAPPQVQAVFERSCYDCHSNETRWPWYSRVAPVSWLVAHDVEEAREHLNFSEWRAYSTEKQRKLREEVWEEVEEGEMPRWFYTPLHPEAALDQRDQELLRLWSGQAEAAPPTVLHE